MSKKNLKHINYSLPSMEYCNPADSNESVLLFNNLKWMTTNEAAFYLRKSANAIRTAICRGQITAYKFRRRLYFKKSELDRLLETSSTVGG